MGGETEEKVRKSYGGPNEGNIRVENGTIFIGLVAGRGKRLRPITDYLNKPMYPIFDQPFLAYTLENVRKFADEVVLVVGYKKEQVQTFFGTNWKGLKISYVEQPRLLGTADALYQARTQLRIQDFVAWLGDVYLKEQLIKQVVCSKHPNILTVKKVDFIPTSPVEFDSDGRVTRAWGGKSHYADIGFWKFESSVWDYFTGLKGRKGELRFLEAVQHFMEDGHQVYAVEAEEWVHLGYTAETIDRKKEIGNREWMIQLTDFFKKELQCRQKSQVT